MASMILFLGLNQQNSHMVIPLQEVSGPIPKLPGYKGHGPANDLKERVLTAAYVQRTIVHTQLIRTRGAYPTPVYQDAAFNFLYKGRSFPSHFTLSQRILMRNPRIPGWK